MSCRIILVEHVGPRVPGGIYDDMPPGAFLESFNPDAYGGIGSATWTLDPAKAMEFPDTTAAIRCYRTVSTVAPIRADGKPNRPLSAVTVEIAAIPEEES